MATRRFQATPQTTIRDLKATMGRIGGTGLKVEQDYDKGGATIVFDCAGARYRVTCAKWSDPADNLRAAQRTVTYLWQAIEEYGAVTTQEQRQAAIRRFFLPFEAPPDDTVLLLGDGSQWWSVLGVRPEAGKAEIVNAYRSLARVHHPDVGGDGEAFRRLRAAYEAGLKTTGQS